MNKIERGEVSRELGTQYIGREYKIVRSSVTWTVERGEVSRGGAKVSLLAMILIMLTKS